MSTIVVDTGCIRQLLREVVEEVISKELPALVEKATRKPHLTKDELQALTGWSNRTLQHLRDTRQIAFSQHGRKILYPTQEIEEFLRSNRIKTRRQRTSHFQAQGR